MNTVDKKRLDFPHAEDLRERLGAAMQLIELLQKENTELRQLLALRGGLR